LKSEIIIKRFMDVERSHKRVKMKKLLLNILPAEKVKNTVINLIVKRLE